MYAFVLVSAVTVIFIQNQFFFDAYRDIIEMAHKWGLNWFPIFIILHLAGIVISENSSNKGLTQKMIGVE